MLGRKQAIGDQGIWQTAIEQAVTDWPWRRLEPMFDRTVRYVQESTHQRKVAYAWSGGKDSVALRAVMEAAGIEDCVLGMTTGLEWPAMLAWLTDHMPPACDVIAQPLDLGWLVDHPQMLFPQGRHGPAWFKAVQHKSQAQYVKRHGIDLLALGRRRKDGNYVGPPGEDRYTDRHGITRWSPLAGWTHEHVFALIGHQGLALPPCYDWPRGYQVGTGPWPARQWTRDLDHGWAECWEIDPKVVITAAQRLTSASVWLEKTGNA